MALERSTFKWGGVVYPLTSATTNALLQDADPAIFYALDFYASMLQQYLGARWSAECTRANRSDIGANVVQSKVPYDPSDYLTTEQLSFPLLAVYRTRSTEAEQSVQW